MSTFINPSSVIDTRLLYNFEHSILQVLLTFNFRLIKFVLDYLESKDMRYTFVREINFKNLMDDGPANIIILTLILEENRYIGNFLLYQLKQGGDMTSLTTFYLSGIIGKEAFGADGDAIGIIKDLLVNTMPSGNNDPNQQLITGVRLKINKEIGFIPLKVSGLPKPEKLLV